MGGRKRANNLASDKRVLIRRRETEISLVWITLFCLTRRMLRRKREKGTCFAYQFCKPLKEGRERGINHVDEM